VAVGGDRLARAIAVALTLSLLATAAPSALASAGAARGTTATAPPDGPTVVRPDAEGASVEVVGDRVADGAGPTPGVADDDGTGRADLDEISLVLDDLSRAMLEGDPGRLTRHLDEPDGEVGRAWRQRASNVAGVEFDRYELRIDERLGEVTSDAVRARYEDEVRVVVVVEELAVAEQDRDGAGRYRRTLTFVRRDDGWRLSEETDGRPLGLSTPVHLWDLGPVASTGDGPVVALHHPDTPDVEPLVEDTVRGIATLADRWPAPWSQRVVLVVPNDGDELEELLDADLHLDDFLAFATATSWTEPGAHDLVGSRVVVNPDRFGSLGPEVRERVLLHELLHVATRPRGSAAIPLWLEEGVAQALGEQGPSTGTASRLEALGPEGRRLPRDEEFTAGGRDETHLAYQRSWSFVDDLVRRHGPPAVAAFYAAVGEAATTAGTVEHHLDAAARDTFGTDLEGLVTRWRAGA
jgi:hypothetical protein